MQALVDYLFNSATFIPHGYCLAWRPDLVALHAISDGLIATAYFSIPLALLVFLNRRKDLQFRGIFGLFALFIFACGMTHLAALLTLWEPYYGMQGLIKLATALVSVTTAVMLWPLIPKAVALPSPAALAAVNRRLEAEAAERRAVQSELRETNNELERRVAERTEALANVNRKLQRELTERKALEAELRQSRERLDWAVSGTDQGIWDWDLTSGQVDYSAMFLRLLGYAPAELPAHINSWRERVHPADQKDVSEAVNDHLEGRSEIYRCPHRLRRKDGEYIWVNARGRAIRGPNGKVVRFTGTIADITEQKRAEEDLRDSEEQLRAVFDTAVDGLVVIDGQGMIQNYNGACEKLFGFAAEEVIGQNVKMLMPAPYREEHDGYIENYRKTGERRIIGIGREVVGQKKDGTTFPMELSVGAARRGDAPIFIGIIRDITERKAAEQSLRDSEAQLRAVFDTAVDGLVVIDGSGTIQGYNLACQKLFGFAAEEAIGRNVKMLMPAPYREEHDGYIESYRKTGERKIIGIGREVVGQRKDGRTFPMELSVGEARRGDSPIFIGIIRDITERKTAEQTLQQRAAELMRTNAELEQFAYVASHDLQEPLRMVSSFCSLLQERYGDQLNDEAREFLGFAVDGALRMKELINDLLDYSRVQSRGKTLVLVDSEAALTRALRQLQGAIRENAAVVTHDPLPKVIGDLSQITQLFQNLVGNAIKFHGEAPPKVHVGARRTGDSWTFEVQDNGIGIEERHKERIFQIFQRLLSREQYPGTGIGLAICSRIVERHGGRLWVDSEPRQGSTFCFTLPAVVEEQNA